MSDETTAERNKPISIYHDETFCWCADAVGLLSDGFSSIEAAQAWAIEKANDAIRTLVNEAGAHEAENARLRERVTALEAALERVTTYDASIPEGYLDEWQEALAFSAVQAIARAALAGEGQGA